MAVVFSVVVGVGGVVFVLVVLLMSSSYGCYIVGDIGCSVR